MSSEPEQWAMELVRKVQALAPDAFSVEGKSVKAGHRVAARAIQYAFEDQTRKLREALETLEAALTRDMGAGYAGVALLQALKETPMQDSITPEALEALSKATGVSETVDHGRWSCTIHFGEGEEARANMRAVADFALSSRRTGQLIHAVPSGDEVEAVANAMRTYQASNRTWRMEDLATAAIARLDAVRGKQ